MKVNLYRLYAIQEFNRQKIAVYVNEGEHPSIELINDAEEIAKGIRRRHEVLAEKDWFYEKDKNGENRKKLTFFTKVFTRALDIISNNENIDKAIFVKSPHIKHWKGENTLYYNKSFEIMKTDKPVFSGCEEIGKLII